MSWVESHIFDEPFADVRGDPRRADVLGAELAREIGPSHPLANRDWTVVAEGIPQDDVVITHGERVALVHLTWSGHAEPSPWPATLFLPTQADFEVLVSQRY
ncbi:MAG: hypothetical protein WAV45_01515 [Propionibacteriaceae bacterium]|nr:hypothetical protein [Micropruina sp.]